MDRFRSGLTAKLTSLAVLFANGASGRILMIMFAGSRYSKFGGRLLTERGRIMYAIEFRAWIRNGVIEIPAQYRDRFREMVKVIILTEPSEPTSTIIDQLLESPLKVVDFTPLCREEIYTRG